MYKRLLIILAVISILATLFGVAANPVGPEKKSVTLVSVGYYHEKGVVFNFKLTGEFKDKELKGSLKVGSKTIKVYCKRKDNDAQVNALCVAPSITSRLAGKQGVITFAGSNFTVIIPARPH